MGAGVAEALDRDTTEHGAPLVCRMDRASARRIEVVLEVLRLYHVLLLHGPPHHVQYYGQVERQIREQRAWLTAGDIDDDALPCAFGERAGRAQRDHASEA